MKTPSAKGGKATTTGTYQGRRGDSAASALARYRTKTEIVYEELRGAILAGTYPPGARIVADQLAEQYGISKVPIREAIVRLVGEGWLESNPHVGAIVPHLSPDEILETAIIRAAIEGVACRLAAEHLTAEDIQRLRALATRMDEAAAADRPDYPQLNLQFHSSIFNACPYPQLRQLVASFAEKSLRLRTVRFVPQYLPDSQAEHWLLLQALEQHDGEAAERIAREHIEKAGRLLWRFATESESLDGTAFSGHSEQA